MACDQIGMVQGTSCRMIAPRYAVYYAPEPDDPIWVLGSEWLGRDAYKGMNVERRIFASISNDQIDALTSSPRRYGFHATMKAPFELAADKSEDALLAKAQAFASSQSVFNVFVAPLALGKFLALKLTEPSDQMTQLHTACVKELDEFRAPISEADIARRRKSKLTPEQDAYMLEWGYPYIFEQFRWHMTLSNKIEDNTVRDHLLKELQELFHDACLMPHPVSGIAIYKQDNRDAPFEIIDRFAFSEA